MKCICIKKCYIPIIREKPDRYNLGDIVDAKVCPPHFEPLDTNILDFATAGEEELLERDWAIRDMKDFMFKTYRRRTNKTRRDSLVTELLDCRYRDITNTDTEV